VPTRLTAATGRPITPSPLRGEGWGGGGWIHFRLQVKNGGRAPPTRLARNAIFAIMEIWNCWINAAFTRTGTPASAARRWSAATARNAWIYARPAPTPASTANFAPAASSGNSAARKPGTGVRRMDDWAQPHPCIFNRYLS
jgi:hypothetical protein